MATVSLPASYRDPDGFVFSHHGRILRQVNPSYGESYDRLMSSGLYEDLVGKGLLIPHKEVRIADSAQAYRILEPERIPLITYPYEWCFGQLQDAALTTLEVLKTALTYDMALKDASSFNIQFHRGKPVFIDTLSFEPYAGGPWVGYKQFCEQFLGPLAVSSYTDARTVRLTADYGGSLPLDLAVRLLPVKARFNTGLFIHLFMHARSQASYADKPLKEASSSRGGTFTKTSLLGLVDSLESTVKGLHPHRDTTVWTRYADSEVHPSYENDALEEKKRYVRKFLATVIPQRVWDIGANTGVFSRIASEMGVLTVSMDNDYTVVEKNYEAMKRSGETTLLPVVGDITNPTPGSGWANAEREPLLSRIGADTILALAILHHLVLTYNLPFSAIAGTLAARTTWLIIEFVPREDKQAQGLMQGRDALFGGYTKEAFETAFGEVFSIEERVALKKSKRILYLMRSKHGV